MYEKPTSQGKQLGRLTKFAGRAAQFGLLVATLFIALTARNLGAVPVSGLTTTAPLVAVSMTSVGARLRPGLPSSATPVATTPTNARAVTPPDPACFDRCQADLASCLAIANGDPVAQFQCQMAYNGCGELCM